MSAKMMTVNPKPGQYKNVARSPRPSGCGTDFSAFAWIRPQGVSTRKAPSKIQNFNFKAPVGSSPHKQKPKSPAKGQEGIDNRMNVATEPGETSEFNSTMDGDLLSLCKAAEAEEQQWRKSSSGGSPVSTDIQPSEYTSECSGNSAANSGTNSGDCSPLSTGFSGREPTSSDVDGIEQAVNNKLLFAITQRAERVLEQEGGSIDPSLAKGLQQYIKTAKATQQGEAKKGDVLAIKECLEQLLISISSRKAFETPPTTSSNPTPQETTPTPTPTTSSTPILSTSIPDSSVNSVDPDSGSNSPTLETKQHSPHLIARMGDVNTGNDGDVNTGVVESKMQFEESAVTSKRQFRASTCEDDLAFFTLGCAGTESEVLLHVYDVGMIGQPIHKVLATLGTGAYHLGVEVYGREFSYGKMEVDSGCDATGVTMQQPCKHPAHQYSGTVSLGRTKLSPSQFKELIDELKILWPAKNYHWLRNNCVSFAEVLCARLGVSPPPEHVGSLAKGLKNLAYGGS